MTSPTMLLIISRFLYLLVWSRFFLKIALLYLFAMWLIGRYFWKILCSEIEKESISVKSPKCFYKKYFYGFHFNSYWQSTKKYKQNKILVCFSKHQSVLIKTRYCLCLDKCLCCHCLKMKILWVLFRTFKPQTCTQRLIISPFSVVVAKFLLRFTLWNGITAFFICWINVIYQSYWNK